MTSSPRTYDRIARFYDVDMAQNMRFDDVALRVMRAVGLRLTFRPVTTGWAGLFATAFRRSQNAMALSDVSSQCIRRVVPQSQ